MGSTSKRGGFLLPAGIAFVGFTTQFGGGFASGAQIYQYFINYGFWGLLMPFLAQFIFSLFYWYGMRYAYRHKLYDYRSFSKKFYGKFSFIFSNLYELIYFVMICLAPAVAFATGGLTLSDLTGLPYIASTIIIGLFILIVALFGTNLVRRCSSVLSVLIIAGLFAVLIPNIIAQWDTITQNIVKMWHGSVPIGSTCDGSFLSALWSGIIYGVFQVAAIGLMYQHVETLNDEKQVAQSMRYMYIVNVITMMLSVIGLLAIAFKPEFKEYANSIPVMLFVKSGVGAKFLTPIISILIFLGAITTGVNMISGIVTSVVNSLEKNKTRDEATHKVRGHLARCFIVSLIFTALAFAISQLGLIPLVKTGYSYIGYATLVVIIIPFIIHFIYTKVKRKA